ncbi:MAG: hypothetical protein FD144_4722 [Rhodospirillaceae bacterium]|nr:MAG: hypothetical protein FD144_4722 [Rhodospirillaceae bacterium]
MPFRRFLAPLLGTVILAITAFVGTGAASAHPGHAHAHAHGASAPLQILPAAEETAVPAPSAAMGAEVVIEVEATKPTSFDVAVNDRPGRELPDTGCVGMCCDNTHCGGCVKIAFGKASLPAPLLRAWLPASAEARRLTGRLAEGPRKPPRTFI